jgi:hypothetical protein
VGRAKKSQPLSETDKNEWVILKSERFKQVVPTLTAFGSKDYKYTATGGRIKTRVLMMDVTSRASHYVIIPEVN